MTIVIWARIDAAAAFPQNVIEDTASMAVHLVGLTRCIRPRIGGTMLVKGFVHMLKRHGMEGQAWIIA